MAHLWELVPRNNGELMLRWKAHLGHTAIAFTVALSGLVLFAPVVRQLWHLGRKPRPSDIALASLVAYFVIHEVRDAIQFGFGWPDAIDTLWDGFQHLPGAVVWTAENFGALVTWIGLVAWMGVYFISVVLVAT